MNSPPRLRRICHCTVCTHIFMNERDLRFHMRNEHRSTGPVVRCERLHPTVCLLCAHFYKTKKGLRIHMKENHEPDLIVKEGTFKIAIRKLEFRTFKTKRYLYS